MASLVRIKMPPTVIVEVLPLALHIKGPQGEKTIQKHNSFDCILSDNGASLVCTLNQKNKIKKTNALEKTFGFFVAQLKNTIKGVYKGFFTELKLNGVGYRFLAYQNNTLKFKAGFCNDLEYRIPESIQVFIESPTSILLFSYDFDLLKQVSSKLKNFKKPDAYKGKGFSFSNEILSLKEVKKS